MTHAGDTDHSSSHEEQTADTYGLYDGFDAYRTPTDDDYHHLFENGMIVPDANVFLNLYRYSEQTRHDSLAILNGIRENLWVPHQVLAEFWLNRDRVLQDPRDTEKTIKSLNDQRISTTSMLNSWINRVGLPDERKKKFDQMLTSTYDAIIDDIKKLSDSDAVEFARDTNKDPVLAKLEPILEGRIGPRPSEESYRETLEEAKRRADAKIPPGYKDSAKGGDRSAGDYLVWSQIIEEAKREPRDILLVTGDLKEDWWRREHGELRGPHPHLAEEARISAGIRLFMLRPEALLRIAGKILSIRVQDESIQDIERVKGDWNVTYEPLSIADIHINWQTILDRMKGKRRVAWMMLQNSEPIMLEDSNLIISFPRRGDVKGFKTGQYDKMLNEILTDLFEEEISITAVTKEEADKLRAARPDEFPEEITKDIDLEYSEEPPF